MTDPSSPPGPARDPTTPHPSLQDRKVLVVGASSGIGRAIAAAAGRRGAQVATMARRAGRLAELAGDAGGSLAAFPGDVSDEQTCEKVVGGALEWLGGLDHLVYAAGTAPLGTIEQLQAADWHRVLATNIVGAAVVLRAALPALLASERPVVVLLSSHSVPEPWPGLVAYAASKGALEALARGLKSEQPGVEVVVVRVGPTLTPFADAWEPERAAAAFDCWLSQGYLRHRVLEPEEVASAVVTALAGPPAPGTGELTVLGEVEAPGG